METSVPAVETLTEASLDLNYSDCSPFLNWTEKPLGSGDERAIVFRSLVATLMLQPALDDSLEVKAVKFLKSVNPEDQQSADAFLNKIGRTIDESPRNFVQSTVVLLSSPHKAIINASMKILKPLLTRCSIQGMPQNP
ncbi:hypothetical protein BLNAU_14354 [Blattamonas nauphoetae]|uniref:Uncharacterized protein n=1 Tax=Blattamonas nauphoetae TaxID=2049346 RepID=A0ABQ9XDZ3_9EUKA|nr:hypothetical protein BLNAU_14354 [Blattamonas nauphoetae]